MVEKMKGVGTEAKERGILLGRYRQDGIVVYTAVETSSMQYTTTSIQKA